MNQTGIIVIYLIYGIVTIAFIIYSWIGLYNLHQFGYEGDASRSVLILYCLTAILIVIFSIIGIILLT